MLANGLRSHLSESGIVVANGIQNIAKLAAIVQAEGKHRLPPAAVEALGVIIGQSRDLKGRIDLLDKAILLWHRKNPEARRLATIPSIGPIGPRPCPPPSPTPLSSSRAGNWPPGWDWCPGRIHPAARKGSAGSRSKATTISANHWRSAPPRCSGWRARHATNDTWVPSLLERKPSLVVTVALANKMARTAWAIMAWQKAYKNRPAQA